VWNPGLEQVIGISVFLISPFVGPVLGPIVGGFVTETIGWRWTIWILLIFAACVVPFQILAPETYGPFILTKKAKRLQKEGKNVIPPKSRRFAAVMAIALKRPPRMLFTEILVFLIALYASFLFGLLFFFFLAYPLTFGPIYGFNLGSRGLAFIGIGLGTVSGNISFIYLFQWFHKKKAFSNLMNAFLGPPMIGSVMLPISLFWFGWTARKGVHWIVPIIAGFPFGFSMMLLFAGTSVYLSTTYRQYAASAFAVNSWMRYSFAAAFPLFATQSMIPH
jgi:MFS family permease